MIERKPGESIPPQVKREQGACPKCGGKEFEFIWRRREKVCRKCGEVLPARRNH